MRDVFDWLGRFRRIDPPSIHDEVAAYHARRFVQERESARRAGSTAARDAHRRLAAAHRVAMEGGTQDRQGGSAEQENDAAG